MKIYDVDAAIREQRPVVRLRGEAYRLADFTIAARMKMTAQRMDARDALLKSEEAGEDVTDDLQALQGLAVQGLLEGVPDDVAAALSEAEFSAVVRAVAAAREVPIEVVPTAEESEAT